MLRPYRVTLPNGVTTTLLLTRDTAERDYPGAVAVAQETASTPEAPAVAEPEQEAESETAAEAEADEPTTGKKHTK